MRYFDAHSDLLFDVEARRRRGEDRVLERTRLPELRRSGAEGLCFALWLEPGTPEPMAQTCRMVEAARQEVTETPGLRLVRWTEEAEQARREGAFYGFLSAEGLDAIGKDTGRIQEYAAFGCASIMLTWNGENALAAGAGCGNDRGLTAWGRLAVKEIYRQGMLLDVSHLNERSFWDALDAAEGPVFASHSNTRALCDVPRNLTDAQLRAIRDTGGVVGVNSWRSFLDPDPQKQTVRRLAEHTCHLVEICGIDHVGCGFDFCDFLPGMEGDGTAGLAGSGEVPNFFRSLTELGFREAEVEKIARENFLRLFRKSRV